MGLIGRQSIKSTLIRLTGLAIGVLSILFVYDLDLELYGLTQIILPTAFFLGSFFSMGTNSLAIRYFTAFNEDIKQRSSFFLFLVLLNLTGALLLGIFYIAFGEDLLVYLSNSDNNINIYRDYFPIIYILTCLQQLINLIDIYLSNFGRVAYPTLAVNFIPKLLLPTIIIIGYHFDLSPWDVTKGLIIMQGIIVFMLIIYILRLNILKWTLDISPILKSEKNREIWVYAAYGLIGTVSSKLVYQIDTISLGAFVSKAEVGAYQILLFASTVLSIGYIQVLKVSGPIVARHIQANSIKDAESIYKDVANSSVLWGFFAYILILTSLKDVFSFLASKAYFAEGDLVFTCLAVGVFFNMVGSTNNHILGYSKHFRLSLYTAVFLAITNVFLNWYLIGHLRLGIIGASMATAISLGLFNIIRSSIIYYFFRIHSFSKPLLMTTLCGILFLITVYQIPTTDYFLLNILLRGLTTASLFAAFIMLSPYHQQIKRAILNLRFRGNKTNQQ